MKSTRRFRRESECGRVRTGFSEKLAGSDATAPSLSRRARLAALLAHGTNLGIATLAQSLEGYAKKDHVHLCLAIPPKYSVSGTIGLLKGKSASEVMSFGRRSGRMVRGRTFWARGYCVSTVGLDEKTIREYIRNQEKADKIQEELDLN